MKKFFIIVLCLCLFLCGCTPSFSAANGSVVDKELVESFPFRSNALSNVVDWFHEHDNYKIEKTDELNNTVYVNYNGNVDWYVVAGAGHDGIYGVDGFYVMFSSDADYSEDDWRSIFNCIVDELTDLCGNPVETWNNGDCMTFYYGLLEINVRFVDGVTFDMFYNT